MTVQEMVTQMWREVGEPTDLLPGTKSSSGVLTFDITAAGAVRCLEYLNRAYVRLGNWRFPDGTPLKFRQLTRELYFKNSDITNTIATVPDSARLTCTLSATYVPTMGTAFYASGFKGFVLEIANVRYLVTDVTSALASAGTSVFTLDKALPAAVVAGTAVTLYSKFFSFKSKTAADTVTTDIATGQALVADYLYPIVQVESVQNVTNGGHEVALRGRTEYVNELPRGRGMPSSYMVTNRGLEFDVPPNDDTQFLIKYYSQPEVLSSASQVPNIPAAWHEPLWMLAAWLRHKEDKATDEAAAMYRDVVGYMQMMQQERDNLYNFRNSRVYYTQ